MQARKRTERVGEEVVTVKSEAAVVAKIVNGRTWYVLATTSGMMYTLKDEWRPSRWQKLPQIPGVAPSVFGLVEKLAYANHTGPFEFHGSLQPNADQPNTEDIVFYDLASFRRSSFNMIDTGTRNVIINPPKEAVTVS